MIQKIRIWVYVLFMLSFAILGIVESTALQSTVLLFQHLPVPALSKYVFPVLTISFVFGWVIIMLGWLGFAMEAEEAEDEPAYRQITTKLILQMPTVCTIFCFFGLAALHLLKDSLANWPYATSIYGYGILWLIFCPCIFYFLEFLQGITGFAGYSEESNNTLKRCLSMDGLISSLLGLLNLYLWIAQDNMSVYIFSYIIMVIIVIYRYLRHYHLTVALWTTKEQHVVDDIDQKERIL